MLFVLLACARMEIIIPNALKAAVLEFGSKHQRPRPFMKPAVTSTRAAVKTKMTETVDREIESFMKG